jgi:regulator of ribonuclease activity A
MATLTSDVMDQRENATSCELQFRLYGQRRAVEGRIRTIQCLEDNALVKATLATPSDGEILVIDGGGSLRTALIGDMTASSGIANCWAGVIVHGAVRDTGLIDTLDFHVKSLGANPRKSAKHGAGKCDIPVFFGGIRFVPGEYLYSDEDGIVVVPDYVI